MTSTPRSGRLAVLLWDLEGRSTTRLVRAAHEPAVEVTTERTLS